MASVAAYQKPTVGVSGLVVNNYASILADNLQGFLNIYGQDQFVGPSSAIYQLISILSLKQADQNEALQLAYNQASPATAVGAGLDRVVKMNGLARAAFTYSTANLTLTGSVDVIINNGAAQDQNGNLWALPSNVTFSNTTITVQATCTTPGLVTAAAGTINIIATPVSGWLAVTNPADALAGAPVETDSELRGRQAVSVALPALTPIAATIAAVLAVSGVTRIAPGYPTPGSAGSSIENPTGAVDSWGNPAHSISMVVEGGNDADVALAIYLKKTIGCYTNALGSGATTVAVKDPTTGYQTNISFSRPTYTPIYVLAQLVGYGTTPTSATITAVQTALVNYLNSLSIGETVSAAALSYTIMALNSVLSAPNFGIQSLHIGTLTASTTASITTGSPNITVTNATGLVVGQLVVGTGIPSGTTVLTVSGTAVTLSQDATATNASVALDFATVSWQDVPMANYYAVAQGVAANVAVVA